MERMAGNGDLAAYSPCSLSWARLYG